MKIKKRLRTSTLKSVKEPIGRKYKKSEENKPRVTEEDKNALQKVHQVATIINAIANIIRGVLLFW